MKFEFSMLDATASSSTGAMGSCVWRSLPKDRWAGYRNDEGHGGTILTQPLDCPARHLLVTADAEGGKVEIEVLDEAGVSLARSEPVSGNVTDAKIHWTAPAAMQSVVGKRVRLRLKVDRATVYSFAFVE